MKILLGVQARRGAVAAFASAGLAAAAPAAAQTRIAPLPDIFETYNACFAATNSGALDPQALSGLGWEASPVGGDSSPNAYIHPEKAPVILLVETQERGLCVVVARIDGKETFDGFTNAFGGKLPKPNDKGEITFAAEGRTVQIAQTGTDEEPQMRLIVATPTEKE